MTKKKEAKATFAFFLVVFGHFGHFGCFGRFWCKVALIGYELRLHHRQREYSMME